MNARTVAERWLASKLGTLSCPVSRHPAPDGTVFPNITIDLLVGTPDGPMNNLAKVQRLTYRVNVWDKGLSAAKVNQIAGKVVETLSSAKPEVVTWTEDGVTNQGTVNGCSYYGVVPVTNETEGDVVLQRDGSDWVIQIIT